MSCVCAFSVANLEIGTVVQVIIGTESHTQTRIGSGDMVEHKSCLKCRSDGMKDGATDLLLWWITASRIDYVCIVVPTTLTSWQRKPTYYPV